MLQGVVGAALGTVTIACSGFLAAQGWQWPFLVYAIAIPIFLASLAFLFEPEPRKKSTATDAAPAARATPFPYAIAMLVCGLTVVLSTIYYVQVINFSLLLKELGLADPKSIGLSMALPISCTCEPSSLVNACLAVAVVKRLSEKTQTSGDCTKVFKVSWKCCAFSPFMADKILPLMS